MRAGGFSAGVTPAATKRPTHSAANPSRALKVVGAAPAFLNAKEEAKRMKPGPGVGGGGLAGYFFRHHEQHRRAIRLHDRARQWRGRMGDVIAADVEQPGDRGRIGDQHRVGLLLAQRGVLGYT